MAIGAKAERRNILEALRDGDRREGGTPQHPRGVARWRSARRTRPHLHHNASVN